MTAWNKTIDITTSYTDVADQVTSYTGVGDQDSQWSSFGGLIHLVTEGKRELLTTEATTNICYIVVSKGPDGIVYAKVTDQSTPWTKINDI